VRLRLGMLLVCAAVGACAHETKHQRAPDLGRCVLSFEKNSDGNWWVSIGNPREEFFSEIYAQVTMSVRLSLSGKDDSSAQTKEISFGMGPAPFEQLSAYVLDDGMKIVGITHYTCSALRGYAPKG
jgi:hypothetical protein